MPNPRLGESRHNVLVSDVRQQSNVTVTVAGDHDTMRVSVRRRWWTVATSYVAGLACVFVGLMNVVLFAPVALGGGGISALNFVGFAAPLLVGTVLLGRRLIQSHQRRWSQTIDTATAVAAFTVGAYFFYIATLLPGAGAGYTLSFALPGMALWIACASLAGSALNLLRGVVISSKVVRLRFEYGERSIVLENIQEVKHSDGKLRLRLINGEDLAFGQQLDVVTSRQLVREIELATSRRRESMQEEKPPPAALKRLVDAASRTAE